MVDCSTSHRNQHKHYHLFIESLPKVILLLNIQSLIIYSRRLRSSGLGYEVKKGPEANALKIIYYSTIGKRIFFLLFEINKLIDGIWYGRSALQRKHEIDFQEEKRRECVHKQRNRKQLHFQRFL